MKGLTNSKLEAEKREMNLKSVLKAFSLMKTKKNTVALDRLMKHFKFIHFKNHLIFTREYEKTEFKASGYRIKFQDESMISPGKLLKKLESKEYQLDVKKFNRKKLKL